MENQLSENQLPEGAIVPCSKCDGKGFNKIGGLTDPICYYCNGTGKVDWVANITGSSKTSSSFSSGYLSTTYYSMYSGYFCPIYLSSGYVIPNPPPFPIQKTEDLTFFQKLRNTVTNYLNKIL